MSTTQRMMTPPVPVHFLWDFQSVKPPKGTTVREFAARATARFLADEPSGMRREAVSKLVAVGGGQTLPAELSAAGWEDCQAEVAKGSVRSCLVGRAVELLARHMESRQERGLLVVFSDDHIFAGLLVAARHANLDTAVVHSSPVYALDTYTQWAQATPPPVLIPVKELLRRGAGPLCCRYQSPRNREISAPPATVATHLPPVTFVLTTRKQVREEMLAAMGIVEPGAPPWP